MTNNKGTKRNSGVLRGREDVKTHTWLTSHTLRTTWCLFGHRRYQFLCLCRQHSWKTPCSLMFSPEYQETAEPSLFSTLSLTCTPNLCRLTWIYSLCNKTRIKLFIQVGQSHPYHTNFRQFSLYVCASFSVTQLFVVCRWMHLKLYRKYNFPF